MTKDEFYNTIDFGFSVKETFEQYITRVGDHIIQYKRLFGEPSQALKSKIIEIFESAIVPNQNNTKFNDVRNLLRKNLNREPTVNDLNSLVSRLKTELDKPLQKELYIVGIDPYKKQLENE